MIIFSKIGKKGNLGNQLFQIASTIGLAVENETQYGFLPWQYQQYFKNKLPELKGLPANLIACNESQYSYYHWPFEDKNENYDLNGWLQSEKYFDKSLTKFYFEFSDRFVEQIRKKYAEAFSKKTILISIRRGDFVDHSDYFQLPDSFYINSLVKYFPDWQSRNLIILSDDINYCKFHFSFLKNAWFADHLNGIEQLCLGAMCDDFIISNSTFSWWCAWLGEKSESTVVRPAQNFDGKKRLESDDKDYFPERWQCYDHRNEKLRLENTTFCFRDGTNEILRNYLLRYFDADVSETAPPTTTPGLTYIFKKDYLLPPLLLVLSCAIVKEQKKLLVVDKANRIFSVSKFLNYSAFLRQNDFGMFSPIFSFIPKDQKETAMDIYVKNNTVPVDQCEALPAAAIEVISCNVGKFLPFGGYVFSIKDQFRRQKNKLKSTIKKVLFIKKK
jgi:hypothetical protein